MTQSSLPLSGKRALVTGAARGIGAAIALRLASEGADVAITYENSREKAEALAAELQALGRKAVAIRADAANPQAVRDAVEQTAAELGGLDILVNNAGIARMGAFAEMSAEDIDAQLNVNVRGVLFTTQAALKHITDGGRIITIGSNVGQKVPFAGISVYSATKSALESFTQGLARELGGRKITVNLVRPGPTNTEMNPEGGPVAAAVLPTLVVQRYGQPEEIAAAVAYLAGPSAGYVTGTGITVDGGANA
ncbi:SDR family oxidoreductase [Brevundimonas pishanensis]|uniref:SDR family oxidoreductase n=1 Tax=Brevundimonas pishanensis TaxID=2896315 RepID=UPI001FA7DBFB|nr:SDR family oxidoreductase [Brevundimonas pishanensis]